MNSNQTSKSGKRALFLYTELAAYTVSCLKAVRAKGIDVFVIRWPVNNEAPFEFEDTDGLIFYNRSAYPTIEELAGLVSEINPDVIIASGWVDKEYVKVCKLWFGRAETVLIIDNHWRSTIKQWLAVLISPITLKRIFTRCWVPGTPQLRYARMLGYATPKIQTGFYSADVPYFSQLFHETFPQKTQSFPKRFLYVGRYAEFKGLAELWSAFIEFRSAGNTDWELWCAGTGDMYEQRKESEGIKHLGFVQPKEMRQIIAQTGVFVLPSRKEPWGVVVHEFAAAGFPLMCSSAVGASEAFVQPGLNGILHQPENREEILKGLYYFANRTNQELCDMGEQSHQLAQKITPDSWSEALVNFLPK